MRDSFSHGSLNNARIPENQTREKAGAAVSSWRAFFCTQTHEAPGTHPSAPCLDSSPVTPHLCLSRATIRAAPRRTTRPGFKLHYRGGGAVILVAASGPLAFLVQEHMAGSSPHSLYRPPRQRLAFYTRIKKEEAATQSKTPARDLNSLNPPKMLRTANRVQSFNQ